MMNIIVTYNVDIRYYSEPIKLVRVANVNDYVLGKLRNTGWTVEVVK